MTVYSGEYIEGLETRIRELEKEQVQMQQLGKEYYGRIVKAKMILKGELVDWGVVGWDMKSSSRYTAKRIREAIDALDGK